ncbi:PHD finger protein 24-like isoform X1 [Carassius carassius]|uniref:PHD finger protein 24-like isoform X1 n=1 Tax=Carassius carassius TaxID=217509 RepID=UPI002868B6EC|nr:PHD finger protein 24-like isoform X1 [Carassius carassius]
MGVLMSKKQQVEKVQKCSVVVSAFKDGLKDRAAPAAGAPTEEVIAENGDGSADGSHQASKEQTEQKDKDSKPGSLPNQQASAPPREEHKANQEAWGRLRDGKGVEPEDLKKAHQLIPPAFVRPKREANDDQPLDVPLGQREQPVNDEMCEVCEVWTADDLFPCRMCTRVFHDGCLREMGYLSTEALQEMRETAHTTSGWSCYYCDNVNLLLTEEEMYSLIETFKQCKIIPESCLVSDELLQYRHFVTKQLFERDLTDEEEEEVLAQFAALDPDKKGQIEWLDFLYHESLSVLQKFRTENSLVRILTAKERDRGRAIFQSIDQDKDDIITAGEARKAQTSWFHKINKESQSCSVRLMGLCSPLFSMGISHVGPISESSPASSSSERSRDKALENDNRPVTWDSFLRESAIYILAARPNSSAMHIRLPL